MTTNMLTTGFEIISIARRHNITINETADPADVIDNLLDQVRETASQARADTRTLERLSEQFPNTTFPDAHDGGDPPTHAFSVVEGTS